MSSKLKYVNTPVMCTVCYVRFCTLSKILRGMFDPLIFELPFRSRIRPLVILQSTRFTCKGHAVLKRHFLRKLPEKRIAGNWLVWCFE